MKRRDILAWFLAQEQARRAAGPAGPVKVDQPAGAAPERRYPPLARAFAREAIYAVPKTRARAQRAPDAKYSEGTRRGCGMESGQGGHPSRGAAGTTGASALGERWSAIQRRLHLLAPAAVERGASEARRSGLVEAIVAEHEMRVGRGRYQRYEIENLTRDCIARLASEGLWEQGNAPRPGEYLFRWKQRASPAAVVAADRIERRMRSREHLLDEQRRLAEVRRSQSLVNKHRAMIDRFLEIAKGR